MVKDQLIDDTCNTIIGSSILFFYSYWIAISSYEILKIEETSCRTVCKQPYYNYHKIEAIGVGPHPIRMNKRKRNVTFTDIVNVNG